MDETLVLVLLVLVMLVGSYVAGSIPLNVSMSEDKLQKVTVFGAGLLVGTALAVIIPEGVRALFSERAPLVTKDYTPEPLGHDDLHSVIGISLVLGFVFMLLVDQLSSRYNDPGNPTEKNVTATVGLVVHAAADGIALGAAATTSHADVELIVFLAIMLHKAPAAFGLVTFLMHAGLERNRIRKHLLIFSCAAPLLALMTYFGIGNESKQTLSDFNATGIAMLFSAGTFLYVATVHVLPELTHTSSHTHSLLPMQDGVPPKKGFGGLQLCEERKPATMSVETATSISSMSLQCLNTIVGIFGQFDVTFKYYRSNPYETNSLKRPMVLFETRGLIRNRFKIKHGFR